MGRERFNASREQATPETMGEVVDYLKRLHHGGKLRAVAVAYADPDGRDYCIYAVQHLDQVGAAAIGRGLTQLATILATDVT